MVQLGYALSSEEHDPSALVEYARRAEQVGFDFASISDHYHPWTSTQGHASFVWSTLGGVAEATDAIDVATGVTCPIVRLHPAVVAQAAATAAKMFDGRFTFGVGTGELLNEHVVGEHWPPHHVRLEMLEEAVAVVRDLWTGEQVNHEGDHYTVENAQLFTLPDELPPIGVSAYGPAAAETAGRIGDAFWSVGPQEGVVEQYEDAGGDGATYSQLTVCYADSEAEAVETARKYWPNSALPGELSSQLPTPAHFEQATEMVTEDDIRAGSIVTDPDPQTHIDNIDEFVDAGYDHVYVHQVGPNQEDFFEFYEEEVVPYV